MDGNTAGARRKRSARGDGNVTEKSRVDRPDTPKKNTPDGGRVPAAAFRIIRRHDVDSFGARRVRSMNAN